MYIPALFHEERVEVMHEFMRAHPLATLVTTADGALSANHIPLVLHADLSEKGVMRGHVAKANPVWQLAAETSQDILAIFHGPQAYVTPSWYPSKKEHGKVVPSWNYAVVHVQGRMSVMRDHEWLLTHLRSLVHEHEKQRPVPWEISDAPEDFIARQLNGIVGIEIAITALEGKWKVRQNRSEADRLGVQRGMLLEPDPQAAAMSELIAKAEQTADR